tara:strand:- start:62 stop:562 length:501 start_codon:yes stop_codon:yes gene_type:complete
MEVYKNLAKDSYLTRGGFTLVELIVVIVIIVILSSIAVPSFQDATKKARQRGVAAQLSTYIKSAQAFFAENGRPIQNSGDLGEFTNVIECRYHLISKCKGLANHVRGVAVSEPTAKAWNSTSGMYTITIRNSNSTRFMLLALTQRQDSQSSVYSNDDYGVTGCFNY